MVDGQYSDIASGSGEIAIIRMVDSISSAPANSLILIDEPESGVHQIAQTHLLEFFAEQTTAKNHQIIFTTHSQFMLNGLTPASIILLKTAGNKIISIQANKAVALQHIGEEVTPKFLVYVEDDFAQALLNQILEVDPSTRQLVRTEVTNADGWQSMLRREFPRAYAVFAHTTNSPKPIIVLDGDARKGVNLQQLQSKFGSKSKIAKFNQQNGTTKLIKDIGILSGAGAKTLINFRSIFKHFFGISTEAKLIGNISNYMEHFLEHIVFLPGNEPPETIVFDWLQKTLSDTNSSLYKMAESLPADKRSDFLNTLAESLPVKNDQNYKERRNICKRRANYLREFTPNNFDFVLCAWSTDPANASEVTKIIERFQEIID